TLPTAVNSRAKIGSSKPRPSPAVIVRADKGSIMSQRAGKGEAVHKTTRKTNSFANRGRLKLKPREVGPIERKGKSAKIATIKDGGIQNIDRFVIDTFDHGARQV